MSSLKNFLLKEAARTLTIRDNLRKVLKGIKYSECDSYYGDVSFTPLWYDSDNVQTIIAHRDHADKIYKEIIQCTIFSDSMKLYSHHRQYLPAVVNARFNVDDYSDPYIVERYKVDNYGTRIFSVDNFEGILDVSVNLDQQHKPDYILSFIHRITYRDGCLPKRYSEHFGRERLYETDLKNFHPELRYAAYGSTFV